MPRARTIDRTLSRSADARRLLIKTLATQLIEHGRITTTRPRAKAVLPYTERLFSIAKVGGLQARRQIITQLDTVAAAHRLVDVVSPQLKRTSGFIRLSAAPNRVGDDAPMAKLELVDDIKDKLVKPITKPAAKPPKTSPKAAKPRKVTKRETS